MHAYLRCTTASHIRNNGNILIKYSTHCSHTHAILPNSRTLDGYPLRQNWSATYYYYYYYYYYRITVNRLLQPL